MDWKIFSATFISIFMAEMGDKTQVAALAAGARSPSILPVLLAVVSALALAGTFGVVAGHLLGEVMNPAIMKWFSGILFIGVGVWTLTSR